MIGASAFTWEIQHMLGHHPYTNLLDVEGEKCKTSSSLQQVVSTCCNFSCCLCEQSPNRFLCFWWQVADQDPAIAKSLILTFFRLFRSYECTLRTRACGIIVSSIYLRLSFLRS